VARAEAAEVELWDAMTQAGFLPYRVAIDQMPRLTRLRPEFFNLVRRLKAVLDPNGIISPGRYS
jgi:4-cresol dehydrogenase (hydroxylating)